MALCPETDFPDRQIADWAVERFGDGLIAFGLGGAEIGHPPEKFQAAFDRVRSAGIPCILHAGETAGPDSIWSALKVADSGTVAIVTKKQPSIGQYSINVEQKQFQTFCLGKAGFPVPAAACPSPWPATPRTSRFDRTGTRIRQ